MPVFRLYVIILLYTYKTQAYEYNKRYYIYLAMFLGRFLPMKLSKGFLGGRIL